MINWREAYLRLAVALGAYVVAVTEGLGAINALTRPALGVASLLAIVIAAAWLWRAFAGSLPKPAGLGYPDYFLIAGIAAVLAITAFVALLSPPNSSDAMAYHMPRVLFWAQQRSVRFFSTPYLNQIML